MPDSAPATPGCRIHPLCYLSSCNSRRCPLSPCSSTIKPHHSSSSLDARTTVPLQPRATGPSTKPTRKKKGSYCWDFVQVLEARVKGVYQWCKVHASSFDEQVSVPSRFYSHVNWYVLRSLSVLNLNADYSAADLKRSFFFFFQRWVLKS